ncbi:13849_t:CDS:2 [Acaulospora morrowiae]|uniref:13849_t:CDS:1 n=1 Tax=Acaulospora morrowiae TaxID=94023 RepID=A0A9N9FDY9_9GLOM|nr:13849_t:CDS:2 [Acaulospora morrowiae]
MNIINTPRIFSFLLFILYDLIINVNATEITIEVGNNAFVFSPQTVIASIGDKITWRWHGTKYTVTEADAQGSCIKSTKRNDFDFVGQANNEVHSFVIPANSPNRLFYFDQNNCAKGMYGIIDVNSIIFLPSPKPIPTVSSSSQNSTSTVSSSSQNPTSTVSSSSKNLTSTVSSLSTLTESISPTKLIAFTRLITSTLKPNFPATAKLSNAGGSENKTSIVVVLATIGVVLSLVICGAAVMISHRGKKKSTNRLNNNVPGMGRFGGNNIDRGDVIDANENILSSTPRPTVSTTNRNLSSHSRSPPLRNNKPISHPVEHVNSMANISPFDEIMWKNRPSIPLSVVQRNSMTMPTPMRNIPPNNTPPHSLSFTPNVYRYNSYSDLARNSRNERFRSIRSIWNDHDPVNNEMGGGDNVVRTRPSNRSLASPIPEGGDEREKETVQINGITRVVSDPEKMRRLVARKMISQMDADQ